MIRNISYKRKYLFSLVFIFLIQLFDISNFEVFLNLRFNNHIILSLAWGILLIFEELNSSLHKGENIYRKEIELSYYKSRKVKGNAV